MAHSRTVSLYSDKAINIVYVVGTDILINSDRYGLSCLCSVVHIPFEKCADPVVELGHHLLIYTVTVKLCYTHKV